MNRQMDIVEQLLSAPPTGWREIFSRAAHEIARLRSEVERLRQWKRQAQEDIIALGQMVGRHCPLCTTEQTVRRCRGGVACRYPACGEDCPGR